MRGGRGNVEKEKGANKSREFEGEKMTKARNMSVDVEDHYHVYSAQTNQVYGYSDNLAHIGYAYRERGRGS